MNMNSHSESIRQELTEAKKALQATPEAQRVRELEEAYLKAFKAEETEQAALAAKELEKNKQTLIEAGFECRTGHTTYATNHHDSTSPNGKPYTFIILKKELPKIEHIEEWSRGTSVEFSSVEKSYDFDEIDLGRGETEQKAWKPAVEEYLYIGEWSRGTSVKFSSVEKSYDFDEIGLGNGETEQEAWESAVEEYLYDADNLSIYLSQLD